MDTLSSVIRVSLYFLGLAAISYIIWTTFSNQYHKKSIAVIVDPASEKIFLNLDSNVDFRSTLINEINLRIDAFADVLKGFAAEQMLAREAPEDIPLKALGVDTSTNEINRITRNVFGISPAYEVRISAICPAGSCVFDNKTERVSVEAASKLTVVVDLRARDQHKRLSFPDIPVTNPALRRGLKNAIGKTSEELIALVDPLRASVLFLNLGIGAGGGRFLDETNDYLNRAAGETVALRNDSGGGTCLAEVVFGDLVALLGDIQGGLDLLRGVTKRAQADPLCQTVSELNTAMVQIRDYRSKSDRNIAKASATVKELAGINDRALGQENREYKDLVILEMRLLELYDRLLAPYGGWSVISDPNTKITENGDAEVNYKSIRNIMMIFKNHFAPRAKQPKAHEFFNFLELLPERIVPETSTSVRYGIAKDAIALLDDYISKDATPRRLLVIKTKLIMEMLDAATQDPTLRADLLDLVIKALVSAQNAGVTGALSPISEEKSQLEPLILEGDVWYAFGNLEKAKATYAKAVQKFIEEDEPSHELVWLADATARWLTVLTRDGACKTRPARIPEWDFLWIQLGAATDHDPCDIVGPDRPWPGRSAEQFGILRTVFAEVSESVRRCGKAHDMPTRDAPVPAGAPGLAISRENIQVTRCLLKTGAASAAISTEFLLSHHLIRSRPPSTPLW